MFCGIALLITLFIQTQQQCATKKDNVTYYTTQYEKHRWRGDSLISGNGLTFTLNATDNSIAYHPAFYMINEDDHGGLRDKVYALRAYDIASTGAWTNHFAFLELDSKNNQFDIYYSVGNIHEMNKAPAFPYFVKMTASVPNLKCFDLEYINPELWIVDCALINTDSPMTNYLYFVNKTDTPLTTEPKKVEVPNHKNYKSVQGRKIQYHVYYKTTFGLEAPAPPDPVRMLLRGQTAYNSEVGTYANLDQDCIIDLLLINKDGTISDTQNSLTKVQISKDTGNNVNFTLIDFKVMPNGNVYILDATEGIYVYKVTIDGIWTYVKTIQTMNGIAFGFDVNNRLLGDGTSYLHIAVLYESNMLTFINGKQQNGYRLNFTASHPSQIFLSQEYVIIVNQQVMYLYNSEMPYLLHTQTLISDSYLVNPYAPDFVLIDNTITRRYELSDGYIEAHSQASTGGTTLKFSATDGAQTCQSIITYKVLPETDMSVYGLGHDPFPEMITYPAIPFNLQDVASGPNLQYTTPDVTTTHVEVGVHFLWELDVKDLQWFDAKDVAYADILVDPHHETTNKFYLFLQHNNKTVIIWDCLTINYNDKHCTCEKQDQFDLPIKLNRQNSQFDWQTFDKEDLTFQFLHSDYEIVIYDSNNGTIEKIGNITYAEKEINKITSFTALKSNVFIVQANRKEVDVVTSVYPTLYIYPIDQELIDSYETGCSWTPKRVFGNPNTKSEIVFIQTDNCIFIGDQRYHFTLLGVVPLLTGSDFETEVAVGEKVFYIIQRNSTNDFITEYNYENYNLITIMKTLPLYSRFRLQTPLTVDYAFETGFLIVRALDTVEDQTVFLVYESNILARDSLHKVIKTHEKIPDGQIIETAITGFDQMFIYFNDLKTEHILVMLRDSLMDLTPTAISDAYVTQLNAAVSVSNPYQTNAPVQIKYPVKFLNTQSIVRVNQTILNATENHFESTTTQQYINLTNNGWYWGHVLKFTIKCEQCEDTHLIDIFNPITHGSEASQFANDEFVAGAPFSGSVVYLSDKQLTFQEDNDTLKFVYKFDQGNYCNAITTSDKYILLSCTTSQATNILYIVSCSLADKTCTPVEPKTQTFTTITNQIAKLYFIDGILFVLEADPSNPKHFSGKLHIYQLSLNTQWSLKNEQVLDSTYFGQDSSVFFISDFDVVKFQVGNTYYYKILIQTTARTFFAQAYLDNGVIKYNSKDSFDLATALNQNYAIKSNTLFYQIRSVKQGIADNVLSITAIVTTSNVAQYGVTFSFDVSDPLNKGSPVKSTISVPFLLNQFGTFTAINKLEVGDGYAAVPYSNVTNLLIGVYKLPELTLSESADNTAKVLTMTGGELVSYWNAPTTFAMVLQKDPVYGEPVVYMNVYESRLTQNHMLIKYTIHDFPRIVIYNGTAVKTQWVELDIQNDYSSAAGRFQIINKGKGPDPDNPSDSSSLLWLWILLGVLGGLIIFGGIGFFVYKKYKGPQTVSDSAKVSLMNQQ